MSKPRRPRVGVGDLVDVAPTPSVYVSSGDRGNEQEEGQGAAPQPASVPKPRSSRPPRASEGGSVVVAAASSIMSPSPTQVASGGTITVKAGALPVFGSYDLRGAGDGGDKATKRVGFGDSVEMAPQGGAHSVAGAEDVAYRVFTPIVDAKAPGGAKGGGYATRHSGIAARPPLSLVPPAAKPTHPRSAPLPSRSVDSEGSGSESDNAPVCMDDDDGRGLEEGDIWTGAPSQRARAPPSPTKPPLRPPHAQPPPHTQATRSQGQVASSVHSAPHPHPPSDKAKFRDMAYQKVGMDGANPNVPSTFAKGLGERVGVPDNESRAVTDEDKLYYSKKARPVAYKPKTLDEFKRATPKEYVELGSLGADLDNEDLVAKRANRARVKHFSTQLRQLNKESVVEAGSGPPQPAPPPEREKAKATRERAMEFAKRVPKPKAAAPAPSPAVRHSDAASTDGEYVGGALRMSAVEELEARHMHMRAQVSAIRREFS